MRRDSRAECHPLSSLEGSIQPHSWLALDGRLLCRPSRTRGCASSPTASSSMIAWRFLSPGRLPLRRVPHHQARCAREPRRLAGNPRIPRPAYALLSLRSQGALYRRRGPGASSAWTGNRSVDSAHEVERSVVVAFGDVPLWQFVAASAVTSNTAKVIMIASPQLAQPRLSRLAAVSTSGRPQCGQSGASEETGRWQSGQRISAMSVALSLVPS